MELGPDDAILALAPLFHITGLVGHGVLSLLLPAPLVLGGRFQPEIMVDAIREHRPVFTVGAITAFAALAGVPGVGPDDFASLTKIYSGGAPIAPAVADKARDRVRRLHPQRLRPHRDLVDHPHRPAAAARPG